MQKQNGVRIGIIVILLIIAGLCVFERFLSIEPELRLSLTTPALLFPAISLLLLAYTNRFLVLAQLVRELHARYKKEPDEIILKQIDSLRIRISLIKNMQFLGVSSFFCCVFCMLLLFFKKYLLGEIVFGASLLLLLASLALSIREIQISVDALNLHLSDLEKEKKKGETI